MPIFSDKNVQLYVYTHVCGFASWLGDDLKFSARELHCVVQRAPDGHLTIEATIDAAKVRVECSRKHGRDLPVALSTRNKAEINALLHDSLLEVSRYRDIRFLSDKVIPEGDNFSITGKLVLHGHTHQVHAHALRVDDKYVANIPVNMPAYGIAPYSSFWGLLKVKPDVIVEVLLPVEFFH